MKNRKVLAFVLALAMIVTLIPATAFAATSVLSGNQPNVAPYEDVEVVLNLEATAPFQNLENTITLQLHNATWNVTNAAYYNNTASMAALFAEKALSVNKDNVPVISLSSSAAVNLLITKGAIYKDSATFTISGSGVVAKDAVITLKLGLTAGSSEGEIKVDVIATGSNSDINTAYGVPVATVSTGTSGKTRAIVLGEPVTTWRTNGFETNRVEIWENQNDSIDNATAQAFTLTLPKGVTWCDDATKNLSGLLQGITGISGSLITQGAVTSDIITATVDTDPRTLNVKISPSAIATQKEYLSFVPVINITKNATQGDITLKIQGDGFSTASVVIARYGEENVTVYTVDEDDLPEIVAGRLLDNGSEGKVYKVTVFVNEEVASALTAGRFIDFEFPNNVQLTDSEDIKVSASRTEGFFNIPTGAFTEFSSKLEYSLPSTLSPNSIEKFRFEFPVTVQGDTPAGDLVVQVSGAKAGIADTELVVGKIIEPISVEVKMSDIRAGIQSQTLGDITIKENFAGALEADKDLTIELDKMLAGIDVSGAKATVVTGDLKIGDADSDVTITVPIEKSSKTPSEILISGTKLSVNRVPAEGVYSATVGGDALVSNGEHRNHANDGTKKFGDSVSSVDYVNVITLADSNLYGEAKFVIGSSTYQVYVNGVLETRELDAPPYIDPAGRTMVPVRFAANSLGVEDQNIVWDQNSRTATIFKGNRVVVFKSGSNEVVVNGAVIKMDVACANNGGRLFVPIAHLANALGTAYEWNATDQTVTLLNK